MAIFVVETVVSFEVNKIVATESQSTALVNVTD